MLWVLGYTMTELRKSHVFTVPAGKERQVPGPWTARFSAWILMVHGSNPEDITMKWPTWASKSLEKPHGNPHGNPPSKNPPWNRGNKILQAFRPQAIGWFEDFLRNRDPTTAPRESYVQDPLGQVLCWCQPKGTGVWPMAVSSKFLFFLNFSIWTNVWINQGITINSHRFEGLRG